MNPSTITRHLITALVMVIAMLWLWPTVAHAQSSTTIRGAGLQPLVEESGSTQTLNIYGPGGVIIAQVATDSPAGGTPTTQTRYLLHDHLGSTRVVLDSNNQVLGSFDYSPFGETTVSNGTAGNVANVAYRYTGQEVNGALGTYNYHARHYDAGVGRFLGVDPARYNASPYVYANDNPLNFVDQTGRHPILWLISRDMLDIDIHLSRLKRLMGLSQEVGISSAFGTLEGSGLLGKTGSAFSALVLMAHSNQDIFEIRRNGSQVLLTPEEFVALVHQRLIEENLQLEAIESILLGGCYSNCKRNGVSAAERFFRRGLERFPNLERVIASSYELGLNAGNGQVLFGFVQPMLHDANQGVNLRSTYDPVQFFRQNIDDAVLRANSTELQFVRRVQSHTWQYGERIPDTLHDDMLTAVYDQPLLRTYSRDQVHGSFRMLSRYRRTRVGPGTLRELPFFSEAELP